MLRLLLPEKSAARVDGFLGEVGDLVKVVDRQDAWEQDKAVTTVDGIMTAHPNVKLIYAANDGGTVGSTMAIENKGLSGVYVFGIDASEQIASYLQNDKKRSPGRYRSGRLSDGLSEHAAAHQGH